MAAQLNIIGSVAVDSDVPTHERAQVLVRRGEAHVSRGGHVLAQKQGVVAVEQPAPRRWLIRFDDGTAWAAHIPERKRGGCGCS